MNLTVNILIGIIGGIAGVGIGILIGIGVTVGAISSCPAIAIDLIELAEEVIIDKSQKQ